MTTGTVFGRRWRDVAPGATLLAFALAQPVAGRLSALTGHGVPIEQRSQVSQGPATPAPFAFVIWAPIFALNLLQGATALLHKGEKGADRRRAEWLTAAATAGNTLWSLQTQYRGLGWPSLLIIGHGAAAAVSALLFAERGRRTFGSDPWAVRSTAPLAGWLTVATAANIAATLNEEYGRPSPAEETRRSVALIAGATAAAGAATAAVRGEALYAGAAGWGLLGIAARNLKDGNRTVAAAAGAGLLALGAAVLLGRARR